MIANIGILSKKETHTAERFKECWHHVNDILNAKIPGLLGYIRNSIIDSVQNVHAQSDMIVDGFDQMWFEDLAAMEQFFKSDTYQAVEKKVADFTGNVSRFVCEHHVIVPTTSADRPLLKRMSFIKMQPHVTEEIIRREWLGVHSELAGNLPGIKGYVQSLVIDHPLSQQNNSSEDKLYLPLSPVDGFAELWFDSEQTMIDAFSSPIGQKALEHARQTGGQVTTFQVTAF